MAGDPFWVLTLSLGNAAAGYMFIFLRQIEDADEMLQYWNFFF